MAIVFYKLLDILNKRNMSKTEFRKIAELSTVTLARISKNEVVTTETINKICSALDIQPGDLMEYIPDDGDV